MDQPALSGCSDRTYPSTGRFSSGGERACAIGHVGGDERRPSFWCGPPPRGNRCSRCGSSGPSTQLSGVRHPRMSHNDADRRLLAGRESPDNSLLIGCFIPLAILFPPYMILFCRYRQKIVLPQGVKGLLHSGASRLNVLFVDGLVNGDVFL